MYCPKCGNELPDNPVFCSKCGSRIKADTNIKESKRTDRKNMRSVIRAIVSALLCVILLYILYSFVLAPWLEDVSARKADNNLSSGGFIGRVRSGTYAIESDGLSSQVVQLGDSTNRMELANGPYQYAVVPYKNSLNVFEFIDDHLVWYDYQGMDLAFKIAEYIDDMQEEGDRLFEQEHAEKNELGWRFDSRIGSQREFYIGVIFRDGYMIYFPFYKYDEDDGLRVGLRRINLTNEEISYKYVFEGEEHTILGVNKDVLYFEDLGKLWSMELNANSLNRVETDVRCDISTWGGDYQLYLPVFYNDCMYVCWDRDTNTSSEIIKINLKTMEYKPILPVDSRGGGEYNIKDKKIFYVYENEIWESDLDGDNNKKLTYDSTGTSNRSLISFADDHLYYNDHIDGDDSWTSIKLK